MAFYNDGSGNAGTPFSFTIGRDKLEIKEIDDFNHVDAVSGAVVLQVPYNF